MEEQLSMFIPTFRTSDPLTSMQAGVSVTFRATSQKALLLAEYERAGEAGLTDEEAGIRSGLRDKRACYWRRCSDLREMSLIEPTLETRRSSAGELQGVYAITAQGRQVMEELRRKA